MTSPGTNEKMKTSAKTRHKNFRAQAMVEFMLALPLLLVLIYGTIEVARLVFIFSSVANASRQAARYGSGAGEINDVAFYYFGVLFTRIRTKRMLAMGQEVDDEEALGAGDVILVTVLGLILGWPLIWFGLLLGILLGGFFS